MGISRILVVDDFEPWRRTVCSILETEPGLRVIAEAGDGLEAVQKAKQMKPDLILLDIGLPRLNGIRASALILEVSPTSKILFLSGLDDAEVVQAALRAGGSGYVQKVNALTELIPAVLGSQRGSERKNNFLPLHDEIAFCE
jgi:DNA-binding NarL/FixJ family response regulator